MSEITRSQEAALKRRYRDLARGITGEEVMIRTGAPDCLGATSAKPVIILGFHHPYLKDLDEPHTIACLDGTFAHEVMHRLLTKFSILKKISKSYSGMEQRIMFTINNIMEDNYIERMAPEFLGEFLIKALVYMRQHVYNLSPRIDEGSSPYSEFEIAAIQYGDGGILKGQFKSKEAHDIFFECLPLFDDYMREPDPMKRYRLAEEVLDMTRPLWESMSGDDMDDLMKDLGKCGREDADSAGSSSSPTPITIPKSKLKEMGIDPKDLKRSKTKKSKGSPAIVIIDDEPDDDDSSGGTSGKESDSDSSESSSSKSGKAATKSSGKPSDSSPEGGASGSSESDAMDSETSDGGSDKEMDFPSDESLFGDSDDKSDSSDSKGSSDDGSDDSSDTDDSFDHGMEMPDFDDFGDDLFASAKDSDADDGDTDAEGKDADSESGDTSEGDSKDDTADDSDPDSSDISDIEDGKPSDSDPDTRSGDPEEGEDVVDTTEFELSEDDLAHIMSELDAAMDAEYNDTRADDSAADLTLDYPVSDGYDNCCKGKTCANVRVKLDENALDAYRIQYEEIVAGMSSNITMLAKNLERIFKEDTGEKSYKTSGIVSVPRLAGARKTARVFTRRRNPKGLKDVHVCLLIDESGSTRGSIEQTLRNACIGLSEVFAKLHMKTSIIGFTGDTNAPGLSGTYHAVHYHYINGDNTPKNRLKLLTSKARCENFDGYSIRYAGEYLKKQKEEFKLLIVLSDGAPACQTYYRGVNGVLDTKLAVKEASKYCKVVGILVGGSNPVKHQEMYGYNFLHIPTLSDMFNGLGAVIKKQIKDWS